MNSLWAKIPQGRVKFKLGNLVSITKLSLKFSKLYEQTFSTEMLRFAKVIHRVPQPVYELTDLQDRPIEGQFYNYVLFKVTVSQQPEFEIDKIVRTLNKGSVKHLVKWRRYDEEFKYMKTATAIQKVKCIVFT